MSVFDLPNVANIVVDHLKTDYLALEGTYLLYSLVEVTCRLDLFNGYGSRFFLSWLTSPEGITFRQFFITLAAAHFY